MKKRTKITMMVISFCLVITLGVIGIFAVKALNMSVGGNVSFSADGILASISNGTMTGGSWVTPADADTKMKSVEVTTDKTLAQLEAELASWQGLNLAFAQTGADVTITFTITNNSVKANDNIVVQTTVDSGTANNATVSILPGEVSIAPGDTQTFVITLSVIEKEINAALTNFNVSLDLGKEIIYDAATEKAGYRVSNGYAEVYGYNTSLNLSKQDLANIEIRSKVKIDGTTYEVKNIAANAFKSASYLISITIPDSVIAIGDDAFRECSGLSSITIPSSVASIGKWAFSDCTGLTSLTIQDGVTSIGMRAFENCSGLISLTIPASVTDIDAESFKNCSGLASITVEQGNPNYYFSGNCLIETIGAVVLGCKNSVIPTDGTINRIGGYAFFGCTGLTNITIPDSVDLIDGDSAFEGCSGLTSITIPDSVTYLSCQYLFKDCTRLTSVYMGKGMTEISMGMFSGCTGLTNITIPDNVTLINAYAFEECINLTSIIMGSSVTSIGYGVFYNCPYLDVYYMGTASEYQNISIEDSTISSKTPYYYSAERPSENVGAYWHYDNSGNPVVWS